MSDTIRRVVPESEARPGDMVTVTGVIQYPGTGCGLELTGANRCLALVADGYRIFMDDADLDYQIRREVDATDQEPGGIGAVVRTDDGAVFVRLATPGTLRWSYATLDPVSWAEVLRSAEAGVVEVLADGWNDPEVTR